MKFTNSSQPISMADIASFKKKYDFLLPESYERIILKFNGGYPERRFFDESPVYFRPIKYGNFTIEDSLYALDSSVRPARYIPFADIPGAVLFIDGNGQPVNIYRMYEDGDLEKIAPSFDAFMDALEFEEED